MRMSEKDKIKSQNVGKIQNEMSECRRNTK